MLAHASSRTQMAAIISSRKPSWYCSRIRDTPAPPGVTCNVCSLHRVRSCGLISARWLASHWRSSPCSCASSVRGFVPGRTRPIRSSQARPGFSRRDVAPAMSGSVVSGSHMSGMSEAATFAPKKPGGATPMIENARPLMSYGAPMTDGSDPYSPATCGS